MTARKTVKPNPKKPAKKPAKKPLTAVKEDAEIKGYNRGYAEGRAEAMRDMAVDVAKCGAVTRFRGNHEDCYSWRGEDCKTVVAVLGPWGDVGERRSSLVFDSGNASEDAKMADAARRGMEAMLEALVRYTALERGREHLRNNRCKKRVGELIAEKSNRVARGEA